MPPLGRIAATTAAGLGLLGATGVVGRYLVVRRRSGAVVRLTEMIPVNAAYWREQRAKAGELLYVAVGDSAAQGIGASRPGRSYVGLLARGIRQRTGRTVRVVNLGQSGGRLREALAKQVPALAKLEPDLVTVSIGANEHRGVRSGAVRAGTARDLRRASADCDRRRSAQLLLRRVRA